jgi:hypothetical protein
MSVELIGWGRSLTDEGFELIESTPSVRVYRKRSSPIINLAAEGYFHGPPSKVSALLLDYGAHKRILKNVKESRVLERRRGELVVYEQLSLPMLDDRDYTLVVNWGSRGTTSWLKFGVDNRRGPCERPWMVRIYIHEGGWLLTPEGPGTRARYLVRLDLGGSLPRFLARSGAGREIPSMFSAFDRLLR